MTGIRSASRSLKATKARVTFCGHVHVPQVYCLGPRSNVANLSLMMEAGLALVEERRWLVVVGSVGQPRDGDPRAGFATYETETRVMRGRRIVYDVAGVAGRVRAEGLPEVLARRVMVGK